MRFGTIRNALASFALAATVSGCGAIYSPTLTLPYEPLMKDQGQITGAMSALPQVGSPDLGLAYSTEGQISYGFSDRFSLQGKTWSQTSELLNKNFNGGTSLGASYILTSPSSALPLAIVPTAVMLINGGSIAAGGGTIQLAAWLPAISRFRPYAAIGGGLLSNSFRESDWGYGMIANAGVSAKLGDGLRANVELFGGVQRYMKNSNYNLFLAPSLSISWAFDNR